MNALYGIFFVEVRTVGCRRVGLLCFQTVLKQALSSAMPCGLAPEGLGSLAFTQYTRNARIDLWFHLYHFK